MRTLYHSAVFAISAVPAGNYNSNGYNNFGNNANFWSATQSNSGYVYVWNLYYGGANVVSSYSSKDDGLSVRCLRD